MGNVRVIFSLALGVFLLASPLTSAEEKPKEALFYRQLGKGAVQCELCPRRCILSEGQRGFCQVRENQLGKLYSLSYGKLVSIHIDPIEKKPLFHFLPSSTAFSIATAGCNLRCKFCQNWEISQRKPEELDYQYLGPSDLVKEVLASGSPTIAYTYSEPTIFYEYMLETAQLARAAGIKNVMHSSGYINEKPLRQLAKYLDAANIDLKGFSDAYYQNLTEGTLMPVLNSLKVLKEEGVWIEITNLILPGYNDNPDEIRAMCLWIKDNLGADTPLHFSRFFPMYKMIALNPTPLAVLEEARGIAQSLGLHYVYIGNVAGHEAENTHCPSCRRMLIERKGYFVIQNDIKDGRCRYCGEKIAGIWK